MKNERFGKLFHLNVTKEQIEKAFLKQREQKIGKKTLQDLALMTD